MAKPVSADTTSISTYGFNLVDIREAFGFDIPDGCAPTYTSRKKSLTPKRGRPAKPKVEHQEL